MSVNYNTRQADLVPCSGRSTKYEVPGTKYCRYAEQGDCKGGRSLVPPYLEPRGVYPRRGIERSREAAQLRTKAGNAGRSEMLIQILIWMKPISGGGRESNPPGSFRPLNGFEDRGTHQAS